MSPKKPAPKSEGVKGRLNRGYEYGQQHVFTVALVSLGLGAVLAVFTFLGFLNEREIEKRVTKVESICTRFPGSDKCQLTKQRSDEKRSVSSTCVLAYKLDKEGRLLRLTKCPVESKRQKRIEAEEAAEAKATLKGEPTASVAPPNGGDASEAHTGSSQPGRHEGGSSGEAGHPSNPGKPKVPTEHGGEGVPSPPPSSSSSESSSSTSTQTTERTEVVHEAPPPSTPAPAAVPVREAVGGAVEGVGRTVEEAGATATGTVEGVTNTTCQLAKVLCP